MERARRRGARSTAAARGDKRCDGDGMGDGTRGGVGLEATRPVTATARGTTRCEGGRGSGTAGLGAAWQSDGDGDKMARGATAMGTRRMDIDGDGGSGLKDG